MSTEDIPGPLSQALANLSVPDEWKIIRDKPNCWSIVRVEKWELNSVRAAIEVVVEQHLNEGSCVISAGQSSRIPKGFEQYTPIYNTVITWSG